MENINKNSFDEYLKEYALETKLKTSKISELISNNEYMLWLENFTNNKTVFCDDEWIYFPDKLSKQDNENVDKLNLLYYALERYASDNSINYSGDDYEMYYMIKFNNTGYKIGVSHGQGSRYFCERVGIDDFSKYISFKDLQNNIKRKQINLQGLSDLINYLYEENIPLDEISNTAEKTIQKIKHK